MTITIRHFTHLGTPACRPLGAVRQTPEHREPGDRPSAGTPFTRADLNSQLEQSLLRQGDPVALLDLYLQAGQHDEAGALLARLRASAAAHTTALTWALLSRQAELERQTGDAGLQNTLEELWTANSTQDPELYVWGEAQLANCLSRTGDHAAADRMLDEAVQMYGAWTPVLHLTAGLIARRQGTAQVALMHLTMARAAFQHDGDAVLLGLVELHLADCHRQLGHGSRVRELFASACGRGTGPALLVARHRLDLEELHQLFEVAVLDPELSLLAAEMLPGLNLMAGSHGESPQHLTVLCLGRNAVLRGQQEVVFRDLLPAVVLAVLALWPGLTRDELRRFCTDLPRTEAEQALKRAFETLRRTLGRNLIDVDMSQQPPTYRIAAYVEFRTDVQAFEEALATSQLARALTLYQGELLPRASSDPRLHYARYDVSSPMFDLLRSRRDSVLATDPGLAALLGLLFGNLEPTLPF